MPRTAAVIHALALSLLVLASGSQAQDDDFNPFKPINNIKECPIPAMMVRCMRGAEAACQGATCAKVPGAECTVKFCYGTYRGVEVQPCVAYWTTRNGDMVDCDTGAVVSRPMAAPGGGDVTDKGGVDTDGDGVKDEESNPTVPGTVTNITECGIPGVSALCVREAMAACSNNTCAARPNASCIVKTCSATYRGTVLQVCKPYWYDAKTKDLVNCSAPADTPAKSNGTTCISNCPSYGYEPVCARLPSTRLLRTFPNKCSADCAGLTITKVGKCQYCKGETCEWASKNDLCTLDGKRQCWSKKYMCKEAPVELGLPEGLGVCLEK